MVSLPPVLRDKAWAPHSKPAIPSLSPGGHAVRAHTHTRPRKDSRARTGPALASPMVEFQPVLRAAPGSWNPRCAQETAGGLGQESQLCAQAGGQ